MRELLGRALAKKGDELLHNIELLIKGKPLKATDDSENKFREEIEEANKFFSRNIGTYLEKSGYWEIYVYPTSYNPGRIRDQNIIKELIEKSGVHLRGWNFPHTDTHGNASNFNQGSQSYTIWERRVEGYRAYKSGLFACKKVFSEDMGKQIEHQDLIISFIEIIWSITEFFLFFKRYYGQIALDDDLHAEIVLNKTKDRKLVSFKPDISIDDWCIAQEERIFIDEDIKVIDLKAAYKEIANHVIGQIFLIFNCNNVTERIIDYWQTKLIEKRF